jgi:hypothetical protein
MVVAGALLRRRAGGVPLAWALARRPALPHPPALVLLRGARGQALSSSPSLSVSPEVDRWERGRVDFVAAFPGVLEDIHQDVESFGMPQSALTWVDDMVQYTLPGGKLNRGVMVHLMLEDIISSGGGGGDGRHGTDSALAAQRAHMLGWCVELVQAGFLVADDMMDESTTRSVCCVAAS